MLKPIWAIIPETASRLRGRIEAVLNYGKAHGWRAGGENPAAWRGHLDAILPQRPKHTRGHHAAMPFDDVPKFIASLRKEETTAHLALEFLILTATRLSETRNAVWEEIDIDTAADPIRHQESQMVWAIPANRTKSGIIHRVPLVDRSVEILKTMRTRRINALVFPGLRRNRPISENSLAKLLPAGVTLHGFRSSFRDWCGEETDIAREVAETALVHAIGDKAEQAYRRGDALEKRRALMQAWADFCAPEPVNVISLRGSRK